MAKSKSQEKREASAEGEMPEWQKAQQKETVAKDSSEHHAEAKPGKLVAVKMLTPYRDVAKAGDVWKTDAGKAAELVKLGRAEYVK